MHAKGIWHRDLKPSNLLWVKDGIYKYMKICDMGLARFNCNSLPSTPGVVTSWYRAPEISLHCSDYTSKSDIWSVGCIFFEMIAKHAFLRGSSEEDYNLIFQILSRLPGINKDTIASLELLENKMCTSKSINPRNILKLVDLKRVDLTPKTWNSIIGLTNKEILEFNSTSGNYAEFIDLLDKLLVFNPNARFSATEALDHPFFQQFRKLIDSTRTVHPPVPDVEPETRIISCVERDWIGQIVFEIYNKHNQIRWYKHKILFQAVDIFDRYLEYLETHGIFYTDSSNGQTVHGKYFDRYFTEFYFLICFYLSIKYFSPMNVPCSFKDLVTDNYKTPESLNIANRFEIFIISDVLNFNIYRPTVLEAADIIDIKLNEDQIRGLLIFYIKHTSQTHIPISLLLREFLGDNITFNALPSLVENNNSGNNVEIIYDQVPEIKVTNLNNLQSTIPITIQPAMMTNRSEIITEVLTNRPNQNLTTTYTIPTTNAPKYDNIPVIPIINRSRSRNSNYK